MARKPADQSVHRDDILRAAAEVLQRSGYEAATMKEIAAAVNLTAASLYHHFRNKDTLLLAVLELGLDVAIRKIEPIAASDLPSDQKLRQMICVHVVGLTENTAVGAAMVFEIRALMQVKAPPKSASAEDRAAYADFVARREAFFKQRDHFEDVFRVVVREGVERGTFRPLDVPIFVKTLLGAHNWVGVWYRPDGRLNGAQIAEMIADTMLKGVLA
ncbi:MAG TPA: TetR/AcrR family transcriptional regulator [Phototrophicaceae bacterium]|nr:TetR/AcrR family transcriptional regulator [Phototrophicaceae bacterium]